ncbi:flagellin N-terminal helical domain-containing protein [Paractinoplanes rishiriensis]|uniref:Flagellin n=1 Tax=Paractinoplanes rishiriensis TaxID=1050105 RepID=A0A919K1T0_9ACTN|nr:flagellin [Actinoplanes rishiriensis]GIE97859.1 flagellin [Actinoplanes rishiriensis]
MGLRINQNIAAQNAYRNLSVTDNQMSKSLEKLSSGFRINRAADDAAGLSISEGLRAQVGGLKVAVRNAQDAISVVQTAEGALNEVTSMLQRMRDLAVQASNASLDADAKNAAQKEFAQLGEEIDRIGSTTAFGKSKLLDGSFGTTQELVGTKTTDPMPTSVSFDVTHLGDNATALVPPISISASVAADATAQDLAAAINTSLSTALKAAGHQGNELQISASVASDGTGVTWTASGSKEFTMANGIADLDIASATPSGASANPTSGDFQIGANSGEKLGVVISKMSTDSLGISTNSLSTTAGASAAITALDSALKTVSDQRADLGAFQNRFEHTINNLNVSVENLSASESRIRDTDMAQEMVSFTRSQILTQAGTAMLSQANQASQNVLSLLR